MIRSEPAYPEYDTTKLTPGIAHFGVGNFHRSHQAMYLDQLLRLGGHEQWGIVGIGVMPGDARMREALVAQNYRYTLVEKSGDGFATARVIGSICGFMFAPDDPEAVLAQLEDPQIRIVSLTITEGGYNIHRTTGEFDLHNPAIQYDLVNPGQPSTVFGYITEALRRRRELNVSPFTVMSCDNVPGNGEVAKRAILSFTGALDENLAAWIENEVAFPNSMVDRITPVTTDADRAMVADTFGITDAWPVVTEPFTQWVLEDEFCNGRPEFERVGVQLVTDVAPYELMKLRLLNASHQAMAYIGMLLGHTYVHEAVANEDITHFLRAYLIEARATLSPVPGIDLDAYIEELFVRFRNAEIADTLARLAVDASDRIPKFVLPTIHDNLTASRSIRMGAAIIASWEQYLLDAVKAPSRYAVIDALASELLSLVAEHGEDPLAFIRYEPVFGDLAQNDLFTTTYSETFAQLQSSLPMHWLQRLTSINS